MGNAEQELAQIEREWGSLNAKTGPAFMERLEAEEYLYTDGKGQTFTKSQDIAAFKAREVTESSRELKETKVHVYGDVAVITGLSLDKSKDKEGSHDNAGRYTDIFVKRNGEWKCVASHGSDLPKEKK